MTNIKEQLKKIVTTFKRAQPELPEHIKRMQKQQFAAKAISKREEEEGNE